jgi:dipeptidyl aminopeptidase/acylaminoacyl peptidase
MAEELDFGSWPSPIDASDLVSGSSAPTDVWAQAGLTWWSQTRPDQGGRIELVQRQAAGQLSAVLPGDGNARTRVHEYGGGAWWVHGDVVFAASWADQRLYRIEPGEQPVAITPAPATPEPAAAAALRYADGRVTPDGRFVVCVRERHEGPAATQVVNEVVAFPASPGPGGELTEPVVLFGGSDFVAAPRLSHDGTRLAWLSWDHPDMPWTATRLWVADLDLTHDLPHLHHARLIAGGVDEALVQPEWAPDGTLYVVSDRSDWWNVYRVDIPATMGASAELVPLYPVDAEIAQPAWIFGQSRYVIDELGTVWLTYSSAGQAQLIGLHTQTQAPLTHLDLPYGALTSLRADGTRLVAIAGSADADPVILEWDLTDTTLPPVVLRAASPHGLPAGSVSVPRHISFPSASGRTAHGWLYLPRNEQVTAPAGQLPPLLVAIHGGPTSAASPAFRLSTQYWTTRGFAVVDVDYGGSTGYGRAYRELLDGRWGIVDVEDACAAATFLADDGVVDIQRLAIRGGSAGGYTTLAALARQDVFSAGASHFGVADLGALAEDTHKFESRYLDGLVGPWPQAKNVYDERSPLNHIDGFDRPLIVLQGDEDAVVPPAQAELIVSALAAKGVPHAFLLFAGEQHGFRKAENIIRAQEAELTFYGKVFGFEPAGDLPELEIAFADKLPVTR